MSVFVLSFPISHISRLWFYKQKGLAQELRHDSDQRRLVAGGCDSERKGKGGEFDTFAETERSRRCRRWALFSPLTRGCGDEQLAMNT